MKRNSKLATLLVALMLCLSMAVVGCGKTNPPASSGSEGASSTTSAGTSTEASSSQAPAPSLDYTAGTTLRMATGYNSAKTGLSFTKDLVDSTTGTITLADGKTYATGDLKPTWQQVEKTLSIKIEDKYQGNSATNEFDHWKEQLDQVDIVSGTAAKLTEAGNAGKIVNLAKYLDSMPNFKAYLEKNPIVRLSVTGSTLGDTKGAIYFSPYFDGVNDIERMPLMRTDIVKKLLDGEAEFTAEASNNLKAAVYQPYMPTTGSVEVDVVKADGSATEKVTKDYSKYGNIVAKMNEELGKGTVTGVQAVNMLREYIDKTYNGYYAKTNRSDLFIGQNAAWDADEMTALLRCVVANAQTLNGTEVMAGLFARESANNQRPIDMFRFAGILFGARGLESRSDYYYFDKDGKLVDARAAEASYEAVERMNDLYEEGLFVSDFNVDGATGKSETFLANNNAFMSYDYNQTQTVLNSKLQEGQEYRAAMVPVAKWNDGTGDKYFRFTESWRSVKTDGWGLSIAGIGNDTNKLNAALKLIDYAYSTEGQILMSYGPDAFIKVKNANGTTVEEKYETFDFNGEKWPVIADATYAELQSLAKGNYTNYARQWLGSTLSFVKSQAFEYQCTVEEGKVGAGYISTAIALGTIKHPELAVCENMWYTSVPTVFPTTEEENTEINSFTQLGGSGKFSQSKGKDNLFVDIISGGYAGEGTTDRATTIASVKTWGSTRITEIRQVAWNSLKDFYAEITK